MKTILLIVSICFINSNASRRSFRNRGESFIFTHRELPPTWSFHTEGQFVPAHIPESDYYHPGITKFRPFPGVDNFIPAIDVSLHNSVEKPVDEPQEFIPPQSLGQANIPLMPPPAIPVNAVASNVPSANGAVFLGSGSLGVVSLGNGAYALGSGSLGYSDRRSQTRPTTMVPVYPPLPASPNLIPAAVPSQPPAVPPQPMYSDFGYIMPGMSDPNAYELVNPNNVGFGDPIFRPPRQPRQHFATPTAPIQQIPQLY